MQAGDCFIIKTPTNSSDRGREINIYHYVTIKTFGSNYCIIVIVMLLIT